MSCYENLVMQTQMNYSRHYGIYASVQTVVPLSHRKPQSYDAQIATVLDDVLAELRKEQENV